MRLKRLIEALISSTERELAALVLADFHDGWRACPGRGRPAYLRRWLQVYTR